MTTGTEGLTTPDRQEDGDEVPAERQLTPDDIPVYFGGKGSAEERRFRDALDALDELTAGRPALRFVYAVIEETYGPMIEAAFAYGRSLRPEHSEALDVWSVGNRLTCSGDGHRVGKEEEQ